VISKKHCPLTGVVNFFAASDPLMAVGSVSKAAKAAQYDWRYYLDVPVAGSAPDVALAEAYLRQAIEKRERANTAL
jgi:hypothetical protein